MNPLEKAIDALKDGKVILLYDRDGREEETDMLILADKVTPATIATLRSEAGGLICATLKNSDARILGLPFMTDILQVASAKFPTLSTITSNETAYGDRPAFSVTVNHRKCFTGVTDVDRALAVRALGEIVYELHNGSNQNDIRHKFTASFMSPGHLHLLIGAEQLLRERRGHTELSLAITEIGGLLPATVICEMLDGNSGKALSHQQAKEYARKRGMAFLTGKDVVDAFFKRAR